MLRFTLAFVAILEAVSSLSACRQALADDSAPSKEQVEIADSCHSGGMERSASAPGVRFRKMETPTIAAD